MINYESITKVHLEISTRCNASCPLCPRNLAGYETDLGYPIHDMSLNEAKGIFTQEFLLQLKHILINGNFGDFVTAKDGTSILEYFFYTNPAIKIDISTNGSAKPNIWSDLARFKNLTIGFDLDGLADTHSIYRRNTDWNLIIKNANNFIRAGGNATWRMIVFEHNKHQIADCKELSKKMGFKNFQIINDGRDNGPVYDKQGKFSYSFGKKTIDYPDDVLTWKSWTSYNQQNQIWPIEPISKNKNCHTKKIGRAHV